MEDLITRLEQIPLSGEDLTDMAKRMGNEATRFVLYENLRNVSSVEQLFGDSNTVYVLFDIRSETGNQKVGHWACVLKNKGLSYYDPYGLVLSEDLRITGDPPFLQDILAGQKVEMNTFRAQKFRDHVNTCGRHCVVRSVFHFLSNGEYNDLIIKPIVRGKAARDPDAFVSMMTAFLDQSDRALIEFFEKKARTPRKLGGVIDRPGPPPAPPAPPGQGVVFPAGVALNAMLVQALNAAGIPQAANIGPNNVPLNAINLTAAQVQAVMVQVNQIVAAQVPQPPPQPPP